MAKIFVVSGNNDRNWVSIFYGFENSGALRTSQTYKMKLFVKLSNGRKPFTIFAKGSILYVWLGSEYASVDHYRLFSFFLSQNFESFLIKMLLLVMMS